MDQVYERDLMARGNLTVDDLDRAVQECGGYGYSEMRSTHTPRFNVKVDRVVVAQANELLLSYDQLALWVDSKLGRWLSDELMGVEASEIVATVQKYLNRKRVDSLVIEGMVF